MSTTPTDVSGTPLTFGTSAMTRSSFCVVREGNRASTHSPYGPLTAFAIDPVYAALGAMEDFEAAGGLEAPTPEERGRLDAVREAPGVRWDAVRALKNRALEIAFRRFLEEESPSVINSVWRCISRSMFSSLGSWALPAIRNMHSVRSPKQEQSISTRRRSPSSAYHGQTSSYR